MRNYLLALLFGSLFALSFALAYSAYQVNQSLFGIFEGSSSLIFWGSVVALVFLYPMRYIFDLFRRYIVTVRGALIFGSYAAVHMVIYSVILEGIIAYTFKIPALVTQYSSGISAIPIYPVSLLSIAAGIGFNPSVDLFFPPVYVIALSLYTISISFVIAVLVLTNILKVVEIGKVGGTRLRSRALVAMPALGVVGGAACCLSLPVLISLAAPTTAIVAGSPLVYYVAYFIFPPVTALGLKFNMDSTCKIASRLSKIVVPNAMPNQNTTIGQA